MKRSIFYSTPQKTDSNAYLSEVSPDFEGSDHST